MTKYTRVIFWSEDDQRWIVNIPELPGCMSDGATPSEALENSERIIAEWIETASELGREIPQPHQTLLNV